MNLDSIAIKLVEALLPIVVLFITTAIGYAVKVLKAKADAVNNDTARKALDAALSEAEQVAYDAVNAVNQTFVDSLKAAKADGKLTEDEAREAIRRAEDVFLAQISAGSLDILEAAKGPAEDWLRDLIEAKLGANKQLQKAVAGAANPTS